MEKNMKKTKLFMDTVVDIQVAIIGNNITRRGGGKGESGF